MSQNDLLFSTANGRSDSNRKLLDKMQDHKIPGISIAVIHGEKITAVVMTNSDNGSALIPEIIESIAAEYSWVN